MSIESDSTAEHICAGNASPDLLPGSVIANYRIREKSGSGGKASVYRAFDQVLEEEVALKIWHGNLHSLDLMVMKREARTAALLNHQNIVKVRAFGQADKLPYLVMECINGITLEEFVVKNGPLSSRQFTSLFAPIIDALQYAHSRNVLHRDIKPSNIMLANGDLTSPKLIDFGLAKIKDKRRNKLAYLRVLQNCREPCFYEP